MIDLDALSHAAAGDADAKVAVKKRWLAEVYGELTALRDLRARHKLGDRFASVSEKLMGMAADR